MEDIMTKSMVIYLLTDNTNGKQYVGQTINLLRKRLGEHKRNNGTYVDRAITAHGWENFTVKILDECKTLDELNEREKYWIATLNTKHPNGYNLTDGGEGNSGYQVSQETIEKLSVSHRKYHIVCTETGMVFDTAKEAANWAGVQKSAVSRACNGTARSAGGYHWFYQEAPELADHKVRIGERKNKRAVRCIETGQIFDSASAAAAWVGINKAVIIKVCLKYNYKHTAGGYTWEYVLDS